MKPFDKLMAGDTEKALEESLLAAAATSALSYRTIKRDNERFKKFVSSNMDVILRFANLPILVESGATLNLRLKYSHPRLKPTDDGCQLIEDILYQVRCDLVHESKMPSSTELTDRQTLGGSNPFLLPASLVYGLIASVVVAPSNNLEYIPPQYTFTAFAETAKVSDFWGKKDKLLNWFDSARKRHISPPDCEPAI